METPSRIDRPRRSRKSVLFEFQIWDDHQFRKECDFSATPERGNTQADRARKHAGGNQRPVTTSSSPCEAFDDIGQIMSKHNRAGQRTGDGPDDPGRRTIGVPANNIAPLLGMAQSRPAGYFTFSVRDFRRTFIRSSSTLPNQTAWSM